ncbi:hypothetical protein J1614_010962 [Plenodomus biglobosus]|nr:hypothetical protein J1614_010962 [Plenodomus biglobosus]
MSLLRFALTVDIERMSGPLFWYEFFEELDNEPRPVIGFLAIAIMVRRMAYGLFYQRSLAHRNGVTNLPADLWVDMARLWELNWLLAFLAFLADGWAAWELIRESEYL